VRVEWRPLLYFVLVEAVDVLEQVGGVCDHESRFYQALSSNAFFNRGDGFSNGMQLSD